MDKWTPLGMNASDFFVLTEGVPDWLEGSLWKWIESNLEPSLEWQRMRIERYDLATRRSPALNPDYERFGLRVLQQEMEEDEVLRLVDFILATNSRNPGELNALLLAAGSTWKVGERAGKAGLEHRVPAGVTDAADYIVSHSATAGALLAEAWHAVFGRVPDPEEAYEKAIKAVEEAGAAIVLPKNPKATLGTMLATMEPQGWRLPLDEAALHPSNDAATKMAWALWSGQPSRHGGNHYRKPTQEEAEAAVLLAVPLVQWFTSGVLAKR